jgi:hypothetical protein
LRPRFHVYREHQQKEQEYGDVLKPWKTKQNGPDDITDGKEPDAVKWRDAKKYDADNTETKYQDARKSGGGHDSSLLSGGSSKMNQVPKNPDDRGCQKYLASECHFLLIL